MIFPDFPDYRKMNPDGTFPVNPAYTEIHKLREMLVAAKIPHTFDRDMDGWHLYYPKAPTSRDDFDCSVIEHFGSFGSGYDKLEIMGLLTPEEEENDRVLGWLTADDVFGRIKAHWEANHADL